MPRKDGTGPAGIGAKTGRGLGPCQTAVKQTPQAARRGGLGRGFGRQSSVFSANNQSVVGEKQESEKKLSEIADILKK